MLRIGIDAKIFPVPHSCICIGIDCVQQNRIVSDQIAQMLRTVDQQLGVVHRQIADINQRIAKWEEGGQEEEVEEEDKEEEEDIEEEEDNMEEEVETLLDLGDGNLLTEDWTNSTVTEKVCFGEKQKSKL